MFSWFSRKPDAPETNEDQAKPQLAQAPDDETIRNVEQLPSSSNLAGITEQKLQVSSPPSSRIQSEDEDEPRATAPPKSVSKDLGSTREDANAILATYEAQNPQMQVEPTPESLTALLKSVPAKTLHAYVLSRIPRSEEATLTTLASFLKDLKPPPQLHCVRCHKDYTEVENTDRSCLVAHDDDSAEVERVGRNSETRRTAEGTSYETLWGCCGKITEGDGSHGPPDGWCYEGHHTPDIKRARFRADSTPQDDKLVSCLRLNCHNIRDKFPRSSARLQKKKERRPEAEEEEASSEGASDSGMEEITGVKNSARKARSSTTSATQSARGGARRPGRPRKQQLDEHGTPIKRPRGRPRKHPLPVPINPEQPTPSTSNTIPPSAFGPGSAQAVPQVSTLISPTSAPIPVTPAVPSTSRKKPKSTPKSTSGSTATPASASPAAQSGPLMLVQENPNSAPILMLQPMPHHANMPTYLYTPQGTADHGDNHNASGSSTAPPSSRSKSRKKFKSAEYIEDSDVEMGSASPIPASGKASSTAATSSGSAKRARVVSNANADACTQSASAGNSAVKKRKV